MIKKIILLPFLLLLFFMMIAYAGEQAHRKLAEEFLDISREEQVILIHLYKQILEVQAKKISKEELPTVSDKKIETLQKKVMDYVALQLEWNNLKTYYAEIFIRLFTEAELRGFIEFYKTPSGQKLAEKENEIMIEVSKTNQKILDSMIPDIQKIIEDVISVQDNSVTSR